MTRDELLELQHKVCNPLAIITLALNGEKISQKDRKNIRHQVARIANYIESIVPHDQLLQPSMPIKIDPSLKDGEFMLETPEQKIKVINTRIDRGE